MILQHPLSVETWMPMDCSLIILAESYLHRLDPVAIPLSSDWGIRWYGLAYAFGFIIAWLLVRWMARTGRSIVPAAAV
ncbi:MAG: prolipoprotein diacylglyceryl transferase, partial [Phycisphaerales bacterium]|nr:prolipoprotein diacylglyceryl transferase [Phycisphaerales bacterium]